MRKENKAFEDDGRTIASMNVEGMPWYAPKPKAAKDGKPIEPVNATRKETWAMIRAAYGVILPLGLGMIGLFALVLLLLQLFWLR